MSARDSFTGTIKVMVVDDHTLFRRGIVALLTRDPRIQVVAEAGDAAEALRQAAVVPDVVLLDNNLPGVTGTDAIASLKEAMPGARVLMLTMSEDGQDLARALRAGAVGYVLKTAEADWLVKAIERVVEGESVMSPEMTGKLVAALREQVSAPDAVPLEALSPRELDTLRALAGGASNKEIARSLAISEATVKVHVQSVLRKLNLGSRVQAAVYAVAHRLI